MNLSLYEDSANIQKIPREKIVVADLLGSGSYSNVYVVESLGNAFDFSLLPADDGYDFGDDEWGSSSHSSSSSSFSRGDSELSDDSERSYSSASSSSSKKRLALKCFHEETLDCPDKTRQAAIDLAYEADILSQHRHKHLINLHAISEDFMTNMESRVLVLDYIVETLHQRLRRWRKAKKANSSQPLPLLLRPQKRQDLIHEQEQRALNIGLPIAQAIKYLHENHIIYRDLKPANCGWDETGTLRIFDFGLARQVPKEHPRIVGSCGTLRYMSPEVYDGREYGFPADVYSFALVMWEVCSLQKLFPLVRNAKQMEQLVFQAKTRPSLGTVLSKKAKGLITSGWQHDESKRPTFDSIVSTLQSDFLGERLDI